MFKRGDRVRYTRAGPGKGCLGTITSRTWENASYVRWDGDERPLWNGECIVRHGNLELVQEAE